MERNEFKNVIIWMLMGVLICMGFYICYLNYHVKQSLELTDTIVEEGNKYTKMYHDREYISLKKENKELYDSLKKQQDVITSLLQFKYRKEYVTDTIYIAEKKDSIDERNIDTYVYSNEPNDSINYKLSIGSVEEPSWYHLKFEVNDKFTIVNKEFSDGLYSTTIETENNGGISGILVFQKKKNHFWKRFAVGPTVNVGYDPIRNTVTTNIGFGVMFNILKQ